MSWTIGTITLPMAPSKVSTKASARIATVPYPGGLPTIISKGKEPEVITIEGILYEPGKTKANLETLYALPLKGLVYRLVTVSAPDTRYDGDYIMTSFTYDDSTKYEAAFDYKMELQKGKAYVVFV